jgi:hypothetical protein
MLPAYSSPAYPPSPAPMPTLTVNSKGVVQLHASLRQALGLRHGQPIDLIPPHHNSYYWHLDLRPTALRRVLWYDDSRVRATGISLPPGLVTDRLTLHLRPGPPEYENYYPLLPANAFATEAR